MLVLFNYCTILKLKDCVLIVIYNQSKILFCLRSEARLLSFKKDILLQP